jgi:hypothetical protein
MQSGGGGERRGLRQPSAQTLRLLALLLLCTGVLGDTESSPGLGVALVVAATALCLRSLWSRPGALTRGERLAGFGAVAFTMVMQRGAFGVAAVVAAGLTGAGVVLALAAGGERRRALGTALAAGGNAVLLGSAWRWGKGLVDVFDIVQGGARDLARGLDPYRQWYITLLHLPNTRAGALDPYLIHYPYGPATLLLTVPTALLGDVRLTSLLFGAVLIVSTAVLSGPDARSRLQGAATMLAVPLLSILVLYAWVDLETMGLFALWLALRHRWRAAAVLALGVALATKPTGVGPVLLPLLLWSAQARREILVAVGVAAVIVAPFAIVAGPRELYDSVAGVFLRFPARENTVTFDALAIARTGQPLPGWVGPPILVGAIALALRRPRDDGDLFCVGAVMTLVTLLFAKWAHINYFLAPAVLLVLALTARAGLVAPPGEGAQATTQTSSTPPPARYSSRLRGPRNNASTPRSTPIPG